MKQSLQSGLVDTRYGRWAVVEDLGQTRRGSRTVHLVRCKCDCGTVRDVSLGDLRSDKSRSCGCYKREVTIRRSTKHGEAAIKTKSRLYGIWLNMRDRCNNPKNKGYPRYGGRGVTVCSEWQDYGAFLEWAKKNGYREDLSIDRMDNDKGYSPDNCRFADSFTQSQNRRNVIKYNGKCLKQYCREHALSYGAVLSRLQNGWTVKDAVTKPIQPRAGGRMIAGQNLAQYCRQHNLSYYAIHKRITKYGWSIEDAISTPLQKRSA